MATAVTASVAAAARTNANFLIGVFSLSDFVGFLLHGELEHFHVMGR
jgi:hypothetical protein